MEKPRQNYPVTFKQNDQTVFEAQGFVEEPKGEPYDTLAIYSSAAREFQNAVRAGQFSEGDYKNADVATIKYPDGQTKTYTDAQIDQLMNERSELDKYKPTRNTKVMVTLEGGVMGGLIRPPVVANLDSLNDSDFTRVSEILDLLQTRGAKLEYTSGGGDFGYYVRVGDQEMAPKDMKFAFKGGPFSRTPVVVRELQDILSKYIEGPSARADGKPWAQALGSRTGRSPDPTE